MKIILFLILLSINSTFTSDVIIIGAGVSGLYTGYLFKKKGYSVKILEARNRIGGRIHSDHTFGYALDLGAAWIHGITGNPLKDLADRYEVKTLHFEDTSKIYSPSLNNKIKQKDLSNAEKKFKKYNEGLTEQGNHDESLGNTLSTYINENDLDDTAIMLINNWAFMEIEIEFASKLKYLSRMKFDDSKEREGGDDLMPDGYIKIFEHYIEELKPIIQLNTIIEKIEEVDNKVNIYDKNGELYSSDIVVVTIPLGCLKKNVIEFVPQLSEEKKNSIKNMNYGTMNKVIIEFSEKFWDDENIIKIIDYPLVQFPWMVNYENLSGKNVLIFLTTDEKLEEKTDDTIKTEVIDSLSKVYDKNKIVINKFIRTNWRTDPYSYGSYSSYGVGTSKRDIQILAKKHGKLVYFAGEHTNVNYPSTVNGAYDSAKEVVKKITDDLRKLKLRKKK